MALTKLRSTGIAANAITAAAIAPGAVEITDIADGAVTTAKIASQVGLTEPSITNMLLTAARETSNVLATAATGNVEYNITDQSILYYETEASGNFALNVKANATVLLNNFLDIGETASFVFLSNNGATAYYMSNIYIDGVEVTPKWQGGTAPTEGNTDSIDGYNFAIFKTADATYTVLASQSKFA